MTTSASSAGLEESLPERPLGWPRRIGSKRSTIVAALVLMFAMAAALRVVALDSDAYKRLSWSSALLTDEGFYIHNARNEVLFGTARTDGFNNMLIMPTLHAVQVVWFRAFGVGAVQARLISVACGLAMLPIFFAAARRTLGLRVALIGTLFLSLDHMHLLYNRLALMDTPAAFILVCCFYALSRAVPADDQPSRPSVSGVHLRRNRELAWCFACGLLLGLAYATRGLTALFAPCFALALWTGTRGSAFGVRLRYLSALGAGAGLALLVFLVSWAIPHHAELARVNRYYVTELLVPHSISRLGLNLVRGMFDYQRGTMPYLLRHSPVQFCLGLSAACWCIVIQLTVKPERITGSARFPRRSRGAMLTLFASWLLLSLGFLCTVSYAPSRYNVLFYPALAALSSYALVEANQVVGEIVERKLMLAVLGSFFICLGGQVLRSRLVLIDAPGMNILFWSIAGALYIGSRLARQDTANRTSRVAQRQPQQVWVAGVAAWSLVNLYWTSDWLMHLSYRQKSASAWLRQNLPSDSTVIGAVAPGLCLDNRLKAVSVIAGLCNDDDVLAKSTPPRFIAILDGPKWRERWWDARYPEYVLDSHRVHVFRGILRPFFKISLFAVDPPDGSRPGRLLLKR